MKRRFSPHRLSSMVRRPDPYLQGSSTHSTASRSNCTALCNDSQECRLQVQDPKLQTLPTQCRATRFKNLGVLRRGCVRCSYIDVLDYKASHNVILSESEEPSYFKFVQAFRVKYEREPLPSRSAVTNWEVAGCFASLNMTACLMR